MMEKWCCGCVGVCYGCFDVIYDLPSRVRGRTDLPSFRPSFRPRLHDSKCSATEAKAVGEAYK